MSSSQLYAQAKASLAGLMLAARNAVTPTQQLDADTSLLRAIGTMAANAPTPELAAAWQAQYRTLQPTAASLRAQVTDSAPGPVLKSLDAFSDAVLTFANKVVEGAGDVAVGIGKTAEAAPSLVKALPLLLLVALVVVAMVGPKLLSEYRKAKGR